VPTVAGVLVPAAAKIPTSRKAREKWGTRLTREFIDLAPQLDGEDVEEIQHLPSQQEE
jgi:hypothetical protein